MDKREISIRSATLDDLDGIFCLYNDHMFDSYLLRFGKSFVKRYLKIIINSRNCVTLVAKKDDLIGFIMATYDARRIMFRLFFDIGVLYAWIRWAILHPLLMLKCVDSIFYPFKTRLKDVNSEFLFISIEPPYRKIDLGTELIRRTMNLMDQKGIRKVKVTTIRENEAVNLLLKKLGFKFERTFTLFKKPMCLYSYTVGTR